MTTPRLYRIEVGLTRSRSWPWFLRLAKKEKGYRVENDGLEVHSVETENLQTIAALYQIARSWKNVALYIDGQIIGQNSVGRLMWEIEWRPQRTKEILNSILKNHRNKAAWERWRMGLGEDPRGDLPGA